MKWTLRVFCALQKYLLWILLLAGYSQTYAQTPVQQFWINNQSTDSLIWDNTASNGVVDNGSGAWDTTSLRWLHTQKIVYGTTNVSWTPTKQKCLSAIFGGNPGVGVAGTVTLSVPISNVKSMSFYPAASGNFTITGQSITSCMGSLFLFVAGGLSPTIASTLTGNYSIGKTGAGTLVLTGNNNYNQGTTVQGGELILNPNAGVYSSQSNQTWAIKKGSKLTIQGAGRVDVNGVTVNFDVTGGDTLNFNGNSNFGGINIFGANTTLTININGGNNNAIIGNSTGLNLGPSSSALILNVVQNNTLALSCFMWNTGQLIKNGVGTTIVSGSNTYSGGTTINAGTLTAGNVNAFGTGTITVNAGSTLNKNGFAISNTIINNGGTVIP